MHIPLCALCVVVIFGENLSESNTFIYKFSMPCLWLSVAAYMCSFTNKFIVSFAVVINSTGKHYHVVVCCRAYMRAHNFLAFSLCYWLCSRVIGFSDTPNK